LITEIDVDSQDEVGSYDEEYDVPEVTVAIRDYIKADLVPQGQFMDFWEMLGSHPKGAEVVSTYQLPFKNMEDAVEGVQKSFGMSVCDNSDKINVTEKAHNLLLSGLFLNKEMVLVRAIIGFNNEYGCVLKVCIRSMNKNVSNILLEVIN
jgi:coatomer subunit gamma